MELRLQKYLAEHGICSRRKAEEYIEQGLITVNDAIVREQGVKVNPETDRVRFNGELVDGQTRLYYYMINKPKGYVSSVKDQFARPVVVDLIHTNGRLYPVGRLDYDTTGLLIITNDGNLTYKLTHPKYNVFKQYIATIQGKPSEAELEAFRNGLEIDGYICAPCEIKIIGSDGESSIAEIKIGEGKNRQIRRMCEAIGHKVLELTRIAIGELTLGELKVGEHRKLSENEIEYLKKM